jgi:hypothetical protein
MCELSDLAAGKAAEHLVVADLILQGYTAFLSDQGLPFDVVVEFAGRLLRIQVKATRCQRSVPQRVLERPGYLFSHKRAGKAGARAYRGDEFDLYAFVALDIRCVAYLPYSQAPSQSLILRPPGQVPAPHATRMENIDQMPFERAALIVTHEDGRLFDDVRADVKVAA